MLLTRIRRRVDPSGDTGSALAGVLALMLVVALLSITVLAVSGSATAFATSSRASTQSRAAAQAGIDAAFARVSAGDFVCSLTSATAPAFSVTLAYTDTSGAALPCVGTAAGSPSQATATATGTAAAPGVGATAGDSATAMATFAITQTTTGAALTYAIFSDGGFTLKNKVELTDSTSTADDASLYSNGTINCSTQLDIQGSITVQGDVTFSDTCATAGSVWSGGNVTLGQSTSLEGDLYAAGGGVLSLGNSSHVGGSIITNGAVSMTDGSGSAACAGSAVPASVCGSVVALGGGIGVSSGATIGGSAYARDAVSLTGTGSSSQPIVGKDLVSTTGGLAVSHGPATTVGGTARVAGSISGLGTPGASNVGGSCQGGTGPFAHCTTTPTVPAPNPAIALPAGLGYPGTAVVNKPPREQLPQIASSPAALNAWTGWARRSFTGASACTDAVNYLRGPWSGPHLLLVSGCSGPLTWGNNGSLSLRGDLAIMSATGFDAAQNITIGAADGSPHQLEWIVPSDAPGITWNPVAGTSPVQYSPACTAAGGNITTGGGSTTVNNGIKWFMYSPCTVSIGGVVNGFKGQIYGGTVTYPNNSALQMAPVTVPGATYPGGTQPVTTTSATVASRYVTGG